MVMLVLIKVLLRALVGLFLIGLVCHFFYTLGKKRASGNKGRASRAKQRPRKVIQCKVDEDEEAPENDAPKTD